ncbi:MAG TPA: phenylalanine 4-monooxygenase [Burkholderiales bacterium]|nr:phenylalanine 4-monooxygenase [Burkholderiales bacterium]
MTAKSPASKRSGSDPELRGDYSKAGPDFRVEQDWSAYTPQEHALYRRLFERQAKLVPKYACPEWIEAIAGLDASHQIPKLEETSKRLKNASGWEIVPVPGLIPDEAFFTHLANRRFPVTVWLRKPEEFDYIVEPDVFHDFFGHVPLLFDRTYADHLYEYGKGGLKAMRLDAVKFLARLYWYTIEFGLMKVGSSVRAYGAGLLSSGGELAYCVEDPSPRRLAFDLERIMSTEYQIDRYQETYFIIDSFDHLMRETAPDFTPIYARLRSRLAA